MGEITPIAAGAATEQDELCMPGALRQEAAPNVDFVWLEITGKCQLECGHCYPDSGPHGTHGTMDREDWMRVIDEAAEAGTETVQFIGGEPTLQPDLPVLVGHALSRGLSVEVFSNLVHITPAMWETLSQEGVRVATSYYSSNPEEHRAVTSRRGSYARTRANISEALARGIPIRVGIVGVLEGQDVDGAVQELQELGVDPDAIGVDRLRQLGRGVREEGVGLEQLCGDCGDGRVAVLPNGDVAPCVMARELVVGNVGTRALGAVLAGESLKAAREAVVDATTADSPNCSPVTDPPCRPQCNPHSCNPVCSPSCNPAGHCRPSICGPDTTCRPSRPRSEVRPDELIVK